MGESVSDEREPTFIQAPKKVGRPKQNKSDPLGSVNVRASTLEKLHRIREQMSGNGEFIPLHEAVANLVKHWEESNWHPYK